MPNNRPQQPRDEELRIALVMNGGVSLAVWIGGVTHEINRFAGETHPMYRQLLELTSTRARVDVISGTSAGGINGAALAMACVYDKSLSSLRELWLSNGNFGELLRNTDEKDPPSLLDGDGYFLPALKKALRGLTSDTPRAANAAPMDVSMTATMLHGESHTRADALGEPIEDSQHRAKFRFARRANSDPFTSPNVIADTLANAARASASFPIAFEPRLYKRGQFKNARTNANGKFDRYLIDGGVLDNKPIRSALQSIYSMPATGNVRRVLAYVVPDPATGAKNKDDKADDPPSIGDVAMASVLGIPSAQSIADQLSEIDRQNVNVRRKRHSFAWLASTLQAPALATMSDELFPAYRERRIDGLLDYVLDEAYKGVQKYSENGRIPVDFALGQRTRQWLKAQWLASETEDPAWTNLIPNQHNKHSFNLEKDKPDGWAWGVYAVRFVESVVHDLLRRTQRLVHRLTDDAVRARPPLPRSIYPPDNSEPVGSSGLNWDELDVSARNQREHDGPESTLAQSGRLAELWIRVYAVMGHSAKLRGTDSKTIQAAGAALIELLAKKDNTSHGDDDSTEPGIAVTEWLRQCIAPSTEKIAESSKQAAAFAAVLLDARELIEQVSNLDDIQLRADEAKARKELKSLYELLLFDCPTANQLMQRMLQLEVVYYSIAGRDNVVDAAAELVQISGRGASPWGGPSSPAEKLNGMQLAHFSAFYRRSWRANDWMMGRLDGISRIIGMAINPDRLHRLYGGKPISGTPKERLASQYVYAYVRALAVDTADPEHRQMLDNEWNAQAVKDELVFLDDTDSRVPETLPACASALTRRLHLEVICSELPNVARNAVDDVAHGATYGKHAAMLVSRVKWEMGPLRLQAKHMVDRLLQKWKSRTITATPTPPQSRNTISLTETFDAATAISTFKNHPVGSELLEQEANSDLLSRTATHAVTVTHRAITGKRSGIPKLGAALRVLNLPIRFFNLLANNLASESRTSATVSTTLLVSGFLFVLGSMLLADPHESLAVVGWSMLLGWFAAVAVRQTKAVFVISAVVLCVILAIVTGSGETFFYTVAAIGVALILAIFFPAWVFAMAASVTALWWTTGHATFAQIRAAACSGPLGGDDCGASTLIEAGTLFVNAMGPMTAVLILSLVAHFGGRARHRKSH